MSGEQVESLFACPRCHGPLERVGDDCACRTCELRYVNDKGVYNFLLDAAQPLDESKE